MTDYTITTNFGAKDSLPSGNAGKVIKGSEFTTEFTNIQTAVNTKADTAGDTFTGAVTFDAAVTVNSTATITGDLTVDTNTLHVDATNDRVGIGTDSPAQKLDVNGNIRVQGTYPKIEFVDTDSNPDFTLIGGNGSFLFYDETNSAERMRIDSSGNVGIGTTSPDSKLDVAGVIQGGDVAATGGGTALSVKYLTGHTLNNFGATYSSAETLIGFGVESHKSQANKFISTASNSNFTRGALTLDDELKFFNAAATTTAVGSEVTLTERMRIDSSGNVLVGTTSVTAMGTTNTGVVLRDNDSSYFARNSNGTIIAFFSGSGGAGSITVSGNTSAYNTSSDERLKENITDSADAGSKVDAIQIRQFDWKADGSHQDYGVIAQELVEVAPEAVSEGDTEEDMMGVDYSKLVPMLIKEVQSLRSRVAELENV